MIENVNLRKLNHFKNFFLIKSQIQKILQVHFTNFQGTDNLISILNMLLKKIKKNKKEKILPNLRFL